MEVKLTSISLVTALLMAGFGLHIGVWATSGYVQIARGVAFLSTTDFQDTFNL